MVPMGEESDGTTDPSLETFFETMANRRCRFALYCLRDTADGEATVDDVVSFTIAHDPETTDREAARASFQHVALPKLSDAGLIDYDPATERIAYDGTDRLEDCLDHGAWLELD